MLPSYVFSYFFYLYILHVHLYTCLLMCAKRLYKSVLHVRVIGIALFMGGQICCWYYICVCVVFCVCFFFMRCNKLSPYISIFIMLHKNLKRSNKQVSIKSWVSGVFAILWLLCNNYRFVYARLKNSFSSSFNYWQLYSHYRNSNDFKTLNSPTAEWNNIRLNSYS